MTDTLDEEFNKRLDALTAELYEWCVDNKLPLESAEDLLLEPGLKEHQRQYLKNFIFRWDAL